MIYFPECSVCGAKIDTENDIFIVDTKTGGLVCERCSDEN